MSITSVSLVFSVYVSQVTLGYVRLHQVRSVYVGGTGRGARQKIHWDHQKVEIKAFRQLMKVTAPIYVTRIQKMKTS